MDHGEHWDSPLIDCDEALIDKILTAVTNVHRHLGPGLFEEMQVPARRQVDIRSNIVITIWALVFVLTSL